MAIRPTVCLDFDGVLHPYTRGWGGPIPAEEPPTKEAVAFLHILAKRYRVVVFSSRASSPVGKRGIYAWLQRHDLAQLISDVTAFKVAAVAYVDDRGVHFDGGNWQHCLEAIDRLTEQRGPKG